MAQGELHRWGTPSISFLEGGSRRGQAPSSTRLTITVVFQVASGRGSSQQGLYGATTAPDPHRPPAQPSLPLCLQDAHSSHFQYCFFARLTLRPPFIYPPTPPQWSAGAAGLLGGDTNSDKFICMGKFSNRLPRTKPRCPRWPAPQNPKFHQVPSPPKRTRHFPPPKRTRHFPPPKRTRHLHPPKRTRHFPPPKRTRHLHLKNFKFHQVPQKVPGTCTSKTSNSTIF
jgi:hypothetical protein